MVVERDRILDAGPDEDARRRGSDREARLIDALGGALLQVVPVREGDSSAMRRRGNSSLTLQRARKRCYDGVQVIPKKASRTEVGAGRNIRRMSPMKQSPGGPAPIAAVIAVVVRGNRVLLVRRANRPDAGKWGFPGGKIEHGESLYDAVRRELLEETCVHARPERVLTAVDAFDRNRNGSLHRHFVLIAVLCTWVSGEPRACDDALDARWYELPELESEELALSFGVADVARQGLEAVERR